jgi:hypothetical protein
MDDKRDELLRLNHTRFNLLTEKKLKYQDKDI